MHAARLPVILLATVLLAGCTFGQGQEATEDVGGDYERGLGVALALTNDGVRPAQATLRLIDGDGNEIGRDDVTLDPGNTVVRRYAVDERIRVTASIAYAVDGGGSAAGGNDAQSFDLLACDELTRASWRLVEFETTVGSQWLGTTCDAASG